MDQEKLRFHNGVFKIMVIGDLHEPDVIESIDARRRTSDAMRLLAAAAGVVAGGACLAVAIAATGCASNGAGTVGETGGTSGAGDGDGADGASWEPLRDLGDGWTRCGSLDLRFAHGFLLRKKQ